MKMKFYINYHDIILYCLFVLSSSSFGLYALLHIRVSPMTDSQERESESVNDSSAISIEL